MKAVSESIYARGKHGIKYLRLRIPVDLRPAYPPTRSHIVLSLGTADLREAKVRARAERARLDVEFEDARQRLLARHARTVSRRLNALSEEQMAAQASVWVRQFTYSVDRQQADDLADEETLRRQRRYKASGVRGAWFFGTRARRGSTEFGQDTPAFSLQPIVIGELPSIERFGMSLPDFVTSLLQSRVAWIVPSYSKPHLVEFIEDNCWACKKAVKQVIEHRHGGRSPDGEALTPEDFYEGRWDSPAYTVASISKMLEAVQADITNDELAAQGLNLIGRRDVINGKQTRFPYCNLCLHCRAPQNNHFLSKRLYAAMQAQKPGEDEWALDAPEQEPEPQPLTIALIPREVKGHGAWVLR